LAMLLANELRRYEWSGDFFSHGRG
jgi:hypothetical protein